MTEQAVIKRILIPTDLNPEIPASISYAIALSEWTGARIFILLTYRLIDNPETGKKKTSIRDALREQADKKIALIRERFSSECMNRCDFLVEVGFLSDRIRFNIKKHKIDMVIMDERMERLLEQGFDLDKEIHLSSFDCPILYVPPNKMAV